MKNKYLVGSALVGLLLGVGQLFFVTTTSLPPRTNEEKAHAATCARSFVTNGSCGDVRYSDEGGTNVRGFPLKSSTEDEVDAKLVVNLFIVTLALPMIYFLVDKTLHIKRAKVVGSK